MKKDYRVLEIREAELKTDGTKIIVFKLSEVEYSKYKSMTGQIYYDFGLDGSDFAFDYKAHSELIDDIVYSAQNEEIVSLDLADFNLRKETKNGIKNDTYYHKSLKIE
ncbi:hypothetical protein [Winogradskyella marincola]|uniref:Uncharacterized protein n=1 Tax=Winogradskyella marincola TaxID=3037795 RepID=A0ABT6G069_9FLAO|nr:hypothetical protein [Winogradskyella sp. YYF002]MDG4715337.1 hypothetical protein [Winogradskyella sp. YYF002]